ncbi:MAG: XRE family transcriptional regulator [Prevotella sp.]
MHIGNRIKEVVMEKGLSACWLASQIPCERSNVYHIFGRKDISVELLFIISKVLEHDFFAELSTEYQAEKE